MHSSPRARRARNLTAGLVAAALGLTLTSCSTIGLTAQAQGSSPSPSASASTAVIDPSVPQASDTPSAGASASTPATGDSPTPTPVPSASHPATAVTPFITLAQSASGDIEVSALVPKIVEQGGTCTLVAVKGGVTRRAVSAAAPASSYTGCNPLTVPASALSGGTWTVRVDYGSATSAGSSATQTVKVG